MKIFFITIGTELLNAKVLDTNTHSLAQYGRSYDFELAQSLAVPDQEKSILEAIEYGKRQADHIILSGGLGPTPDDITADLLKKSFGKPVSFLTNHNGSAQGLIHESDKQFIMALPGVPREFKRMLQEVFLFLKLQSKEDELITFKTMGVPEAKIFGELEPKLWQKLESYGEVSCLPVLMGVNIGVKLKDLNKREELIKLVSSSKLKDIIWNIGHESLQETIINRAHAKNLKIGSAESCTGGFIAHQLTNTAGSSSVYWGTIVSYSNEVKMKVLNVKEDTLKSHGAVSIETAKEMAKGALKSMNLDIAVSTTGIAGPGGGSEEKPVGTVCIGIATKDKNEAYRFQFKGDRETLKARFAKRALFLLLENI